MISDYINWNRFADVHQSPQNSFQRLSGQLFRRIYAISDSVLHADPNNPGIEVVPVLSKDGNSKISFQSKWFKTIDYQQILHSAEITVKYYTDDLDKLYLFCNCDVDSSSNQYKNIKKVLNEAGIEIVLVTNETILMEVENFPDLAELYFGTFTPDQIWFSNQLSKSISVLDNRYNRNFNVENRAELLLSLFSNGDAAVRYLNEKKEKAIQSIALISAQTGVMVKRKAISFINALPDVTNKTLIDALTWSTSLNNLLAKDSEEIKNQLKICEEEYKKLFEESKDADFERRASDYDARRYHLQAKEYDLEKIIGIPDLLRLSTEEIDALTSRIICLSGEAGIGKSHAIAFVAEENNKNGIPAILLLGQNFNSG